MKKIIERTCMICGAKKDKANFIRIVKNKKNEIFVDESGKAEGRGAYICCNIECIDKAIKTKRLEKTFKAKIDDDIYNCIRGVIIERKNKQSNSNN